MTTVLLLIPNVHINMSVKYQQALVMVTSFELYKSAVIKGCLCKALYTYRER